LREEKVMEGLFAFFLWLSIADGTNNPRTTSWGDYATMSQMLMPIETARKHWWYVDGVSPHTAWISIEEEEEGYNPWRALWRREAEQYDGDKDEGPREQYDYDKD
jgi:hypothetical protein